MTVLRIVLSSSLLCLGLVSGCENSVQDDYFPLDKGSYWQYDMTYVTMDGRFKGIYAVENLSPRIIKDEKVYVRRLIDGANNFIQVNDAGILLTGREKTVDLETSYTQENEYIFRFPLAVGTSWQSESRTKLLIKTGPPQKTEFHITANVPVTATIESMTDTVNVPAGEFKNCMRIHSKGSAFTNAGNYVGLTIVSIDETNWYAPNVGLVKSIRRESTKSKALDRGELIIELQQFKE